MKVKSTKHRLACVLVLVVAATTAQAQTAPKMKMTTEVPPGIAIPDEVNTRLGTLRFFDGFPDDATVENVRALTEATLRTKDKRLARWSGEVASRRTFRPPLLIPLRVGSQSPASPGP